MPGKLSRMLCSPASPKPRATPKCTKTNDLLKAARNGTNPLCHSWLLLQFCGELFPDKVAAPVRVSL